MRRRLGWESVSLLSVAIVKADVVRHTCRRCRVQRSRVTVDVAWLKIGIQVPRDGIPLHTEAAVVS